MSFFQHHPDGYIIIDNGVLNLRISLTEFQTYEPAYTLAAPYTSRYYVPTVKHVLSDGFHQRDGGVPWTDGDTYIATLADYINEHENPTLTLQQAKDQKIIELATYANSKRLGGVLYLATEFTSIPLDATAIISYQVAGSTPVGYYLQDVDAVNVLLTLAQLLALNDLIVKLHLLCRVNQDDLTVDINALVSVGAVDAFDITTGWPTVPYSG